MGSFEDHYRRQEAAAPALPTFAERYNRLAGAWNELVPIILNGFRQHPPQHCEWVWLDGAQLVCWELLNLNDDYTCYLYLVSDGRTVYTGRGQSHPRVMLFGNVPATLQEDAAIRDGMLSIYFLKDMCKKGLNYARQSAPSHPRLRALGQAIESA